MNAKGFTLIELVTIIIILGIMSVLALPRFINLSQDAHDSVARSTFASFSSAVDLYHNCWSVNGGQGYVKNLACFGEGDIDSTVTGFPLGKDTEANSNEGKQLNGNFCADLWYGLLDNDFTLAMHTDASFTAGNDIIYWYAGAEVANPGTYCYYNYISDNTAKGQENWQLRYFPGTGKTEIRKATLG